MHLTFAPLNYTDISVLPLRTQRHDGVDNVVVVLLQCLDSLLPADTGLSHDKLNVLGLEASLVNLLAIVLFFFLLGVTSVNGLALITVVVASVVAASGLVTELLSSGSLSLGVQVLNLGLTEDAVTC